jgi:hypothetical protein
VCERLIDAGYSIRAYLEGDWTPYWHRMLELPKGKVLCDIDNQADIQRAKKDIGHHQCICGGVHDSQFILGTPDEMRRHVKHLCETVGQGGGYMIGGGCHIPYGAKPENVRAMVEAVTEFGVYDSSVKPQPKTAPASATSSARVPRMVTPWEVKKAEIGAIQGDENLIRGPWESLESRAYSWLWQWI